MESFYMKRGGSGLRRGVVWCAYEPLYILGAEASDIHGAGRGPLADYFL